MITLQQQSDLIDKLYLELILNNRFAPFKI